jgi:hypothetical protein
MWEGIGPWPRKESDRGHVEPELQRDGQEGHEREGVDVVAVAAEAEQSRQQDLQPEREGGAGEPQGQGAGGPAEQDVAEALPARSTAAAPSIRQIGHARGAR